MIMMIKITEHCSMGCSHCMNAATPNNVHMDFDTFRKAIRFQKEHGGSFMLITGGEPTEHPQFKEFLRYALKNTVCLITVATNGVWMTQHEEYIRNLQDVYGDRLTWQVSADPRYYPSPVNLMLPVFQLDGVVTSDKIGPIYPMGRAEENGIGHFDKASKCFNIRAVARQVSLSCKLGHIIGIMNVKGFFCTPHIAVDGSIKVGESDLCPPCSHIDKPEDKIREDIRNFKCHKCDEVNNKLPKEYRELLGD